MDRTRLAFREDAQLAESNNIFTLKGDSSC